MKKSELLAFGAVFLLLSGFTAGAQTLYSENYLYSTNGGSSFNGTGSTVVQNLNTVYGNTGTESTTGWFAYGGAAATNYSSGVPGSVGGVADRQSPNSAANDYGFLLASTGMGTSYLEGTTSTALSNLAIATSTTNLSFRWYQGDANAGDTVHLALKVGGSWYASATTFSTPTTNAAGFGNSNYETAAAAAAAGNTVGSSTGTLQSTTFSTMTWDSLTFTAGSTLSLGGAVAAPSGNITGIGFYSNVFTANQRFDELQITTVVPEPSIGVLLLCGLLALIFAQAQSSLRFAEGL